MSELEQFFCPNEHCKNYGVRCQGNVFWFSVNMKKIRPSIQPDDLSLF